MRYPVTITMTVRLADGPVPGTSLAPARRIAVTAPTMPDALTVARSLLTDEERTTGGWIVVATPAHRRRLRARI